MLNEQSFKQMEKLLAKSQQLMDKIRRQNRKWPGAGAFEKDVDDAKALLEKMGQVVWDLAAAAVESLDKSLDPSHDSEIREAVRKEYALMSRLYEDIRRAHEATEEGKSQSEALRQTEIHVKQFTLQSEQTRDRLLELARVTRTQLG